MLSPPRGRRLLHNGFVPSDRDLLKFVVVTASCSFSHGRAFLLHCHQLCLPMLWAPSRDFLLHFYRVAPFLLTELGRAYQSNSSKGKRDPHERVELVEAKCD